jgi:glutaredoxin
MAEQRKLVVYSSPLCAPCEALKRLLASEGLVFEVRDVMVDETAATLLETHGIRTTPALGIDGDLYAGDDLQPDRLVALLDL